MKLYTIPHSSQQRRDLNPPNPILQHNLIDYHNYIIYHIKIIEDRNIHLLIIFMKSTIRFYKIKAILIFTLNTSTLIILFLRRFYLNIKI